MFTKYTETFTPLKETCEYLEEACYEGNLKELKRIYQENPDQIYTNWDALEFSIVQNKLNCVRFLLKHGAPFDNFSCMKAALHGHLRLLIYLHKKGCGWDYLTTTIAARHGKLDCLVYAVTNGCDLKRCALEAAIEGDHLDCVIFLSKYINIDDGLYKFILQKGNQNMANIFVIKQFDQELDHLINNIKKIELDEVDTITKELTSMNF